MKTDYFIGKCESELEELYAHYNREITRMLRHDLNRLMKKYPTLTGFKSGMGTHVLTTTLGDDLYIYRVGGTAVCVPGFFPEQHGDGDNWVVVPEDVLEFIANYRRWFERTNFTFDHPADLKDCPGYVSHGEPSRHSWRLEIDAAQNEAAFLWLECAFYEIGIVTYDDETNRAFIELYLEDPDAGE